MVTIPFFSKFYTILPSDGVGDAKIYGDSIASWLQAFCRACRIMLGFSCVQYGPLSRKLGGKPDRKQMSRVLQSQGNFNS